jgi:hypothetical protein
MRRAFFIMKPFKGQRFRGSGFAQLPDAEAASLNHSTQIHEYDIIIIIMTSVLSANSAVKLKIRKI